MDALFADNLKLEIPDDLIDHIRGIVNDRYDAVFESPQSGLFKAALFLDPGASFFSFATTCLMGHN